MLAIRAGVLRNAAARCQLLPRTATQGRSPQDLLRRYPCGLLSSEGPRRRRSLQEPLQGDPRRAAPPPQRDRLGADPRGAAPPQEPPPPSLGPAAFVPPSPGGAAPPQARPRSQPPPAPARPGPAPHLPLPTPPPKVPRGSAARHLLPPHRVGTHPGWSGIQRRPNAGLRAAASAPPPPPAPGWG